MPSLIKQSKKTQIKQKIKIIFYIHSLLKFGGAERVLTILLQNLDRSQFDIYLLIAQKKGRYLSEIPNDIKTIELKSNRTFLAIPKIAIKIWKIKPDIFFSIRSLVIGFFTQFFRVLSPKTKFIVREVIIPSEHNQTERFPPFFNLGYRIIYPWFDKIICQSDDMRNDLLTNYKINERKTVKIYNPLDTKKVECYLANQKIQGSNQKKKSKVNILAIGRLTYQKGFDRLIDTFTLLDDRFFLTIIGEGEQEKSLKEKIKENHLSHRIKMIGFVENPYSYIVKSDIFVLSSRYEGLSNVLLEVMLCGVPAVAFDCLGGIREILKHGINGYIVPKEDIESLSKYIKLASVTPFDRQRIKDSVRHKFNLNQRVKDYEKLFLEIIQLPEVENVRWKKA